MQVIEVRNVNQALPMGLYMLRGMGVDSTSRNGTVRVMREPVTTKYRCPHERVLFIRPEANPFFHLYEGLWMLAGRNDVDSVAAYAKRMRTYSDDSVTLNGAYGYRWRHQFNVDQIDYAINLLRNNPGERRAVIQMWDATGDTVLVRNGGKDVPCNIGLHFQVDPLDGSLNMTVFNRSNDIIWGAYGANAVHMSMLQEYVACALGRGIGRYWQVSDNYHAYSDVYEKYLPLADTVPDGYSLTKGMCPYTAGVVEPMRLMSVGRRQWDLELAALINEGSNIAPTDPFLATVAVPMINAHRAYRKVGDSERFTTALEIIHQVKGTDWKLAGEKWLLHQDELHQRAKDDGVPHE